MRHLAIFALSILALGAAATTSHAQGAWVGDKGALDLSLDYNLGISSKVIPDKGPDFTDGGVITHQTLIGAEYVPIQHLAINASLPIVSLKYRNPGKYPHDGGGSYDDGDYHTTLTDARVNARYQFLEDPIAFAPHIGVSIPVADYETVGNAVAGRHLKKLHLGFGVGKAFDSGTYVHALYEFSLVERYDRTKYTERYNQNTNQVEFSIGQKLLEYKLDIHLNFSLFRTEGGWEFSQYNDTTDPAFHKSDTLYHDAILDEDIMLLGGGVGYQLTNSWGISAGGRLFVKGKNTQNASVFALGVTWSKG